jgi:hypothetical protein
MGGPCDVELSAETREEMVQKMTKHVLDNHPETAKAMEAQHERDPEEWGMQFRRTWDATPDD